MDKSAPNVYSKSNEVYIKLARVTFTLGSEHCFGRRNGIGPKVKIPDKSLNIDSMVCIVTGSFCLETAIWYLGVGYLLFFPKSQISWFYRGTEIWAYGRTRSFSDLSYLDVEVRPLEYEKNISILKKQTSILTYTSVLRYSILGINRKQFRSMYWALQCTVLMFFKLILIRVRKQLLYYGKLQYARSRLRELQEA